MTRQEAMGALDDLVRRHTEKRGERRTKQITRAVAVWLRSLGASSIHFEVRQPYTLRKRQHTGRIDVVGLWPSGRAFGVEIEGKWFKAKSGAKLRVLQDAGHKVLLLAWDPANLPIPPMATAKVPCHVTRLAASSLFDHERIVDLEPHFSCYETRNEPVPPTCQSMYMCRCRSVRGILPGYPAPTA